MPINDDPNLREQQILAAASALLIRQGYDKTTMSDVAAEAGISRGMVYLAFATKEHLFDHVLAQAIQAYIATWQQLIAENRYGGTIGGVYRAVLHALKSQPIMAALMKRDRRVLGRYVQQAASGMPALAGQSLWLLALGELQAAGAIRAELDLQVIAHILDLLAFGLMHGDSLADSAASPPFEHVLPTIALMLDRLLLPDDGGNLVAGTAIIQALAANLQSPSVNPSLNVVQA